MPNNVKFNKEDKQIFHGSYPFIAQPLPLKTSAEEGNIKAVSTAGDYGVYDGTTYTEPYAIAMGAVTHTTAEVECECILTGYLMQSFVKIPFEKDADKRKLIQMLKKQGIYLR